MNFEIGDEVYGTDPEQQETFGQMCRVLRSGGGTLDLIVYDPETRMWEDRDMSIAGVLATSFSIANSKNEYEPIEEGASEVLNSKDPFAAIEVLMCRHRLQARMYPNEKSVADCAFISREELIRQSAECLVRLASASMAPYNEEVEMSKKHRHGEVKEANPPPEVPPVATPEPTPVKDELPAHYQGNPALPENFLGRPPAWRKGFIDRVELGESRKKPEVVAGYLERNDAAGTSGYTEGWNKAENFLRSGGK